MMGHPELSPREDEVLRLVASGKSNREIAKEMYLSEDTVKSHIGSLLRKVGVSNRQRLTSHYFLRMVKVATPGEVVDILLATRSALSKRIVSVGTYAYHEKKGGIDVLNALISQITPMGDSKK